MKISRKKKPPVRGSIDLRLSSGLYNKKADVISEQMVAEVETLVIEPNCANSIDLRVLRKLCTQC
jgi:hypothetical protein